MENLTIKPSYVSLFSCIGPKCADSCCNDWMITFDKQSYKKTLKNKYLADVAKFALYETKDSESSWAIVNLDKNGACPFLTPQKLCNIHAKAGEKALSHTCKTYPKRDQFIGPDKYQSLYLSCPEVARIVLFDDNAFQFSANASGNKTVNTPSPEWLEKTYEYSLDLLLNSGLNWQESFLAIGLLVKTSDEVRTNKANIQQLEVRYNQLLSMSQMGMISKQFNTIPYTSLPQQHTFVAIHDALCTMHSRSTRPRFESINNAITALCNEQNDYSIEGINRIWNTEIETQLTDHSELFTKFILYSMFHNHFPMHAEHDPEQVFQQLIIDCFMIRCYLAATYAAEKQLTEENIIKCFQVYHVVRQHKPKFIERIKNILSEYGLTSLPSAISLLKTQ
ncbi:flagellin lysine-N-methylase [Shewanella sp. ULN5]|uniref:flagellin lysine-N-methylase n=1 Tax=Shewanella sp. ULN5 TaxID=2994678 RepID=UPI00273D6E26|nr:flagellin lysine-N-methylase [Shewanella sp. ULN5]MDP5145692.1 flagellin lysine-N-methylase [Shewanella sp. ULN5]